MPVPHPFPGEQRLEDPDPVLFLIGLAVAVVSAARALLGDSAFLPLLVAAVAAAFAVAEGLRLARSR